MSEGAINTSCLGNAIVITRDDDGYYVVTDYMDQHVFEQLGNVLEFLKQRLEQQDARIKQYRENPRAWLVPGISRLTM